MPQSLSAAIESLQRQAEEHEATAKKLRAAIATLKDLNGGGERALATKKAKPGPKKAAKGARRMRAKASAPRRHKNGKPTLAAALEHVLKLHAQSKGASPSAAQLYADVQRAGFRFGGGNDANNMNYLYKTLRRHKSFKRVGEGGYALA